jgi:hypothetical protein
LSRADPAVVASSASAATTRHLLAMLKILDFTSLEMIDMAFSNDLRLAVGHDLIASLRRRLHGQKVAKLLV